MKNNKDKVIKIITDGDYDKFVEIVNGLELYDVFDAKTCWFCMASMYIIDNKLTTLRPGHELKFVSTYWTKEKEELCEKNDWKYVIEEVSHGINQRF